MEPSRHVLADGLHSILAGDRNVVLRAHQGGEPALDFARAVAAGLNRLPRRLDCRFLYDAHGSDLYEQITRQPEYYLTRTEAAILSRYADTIRALTGPVNLLELGSGSSAKTDYLLSSWLARDPAVFYIPVDVSESALLQANHAITERHPRARVIGIHGTYQDAMHLFSAASPAMVIFLGSSLGNFDEDEEESFLRRLADQMTPGDFLLLGIDLVKEPAIMEAAYNDAAGVTAAFTTNIFSRMNRELGSRLDLSAIHHLARWQPSQRRIEVHAGFSRTQTIRVQPLGTSFRVDAGEEILVEICRKFDLAAFVHRLAPLGFDTVEVFTDEQRWFALLLLQKMGRRRGTPA
jgi:L-histidine N-alpha-methyltransferase